MIGLSEEDIEDQLQSWTDWEAGYSEGYGDGYWDGVLDNTKSFRDEDMTEFHLQMLLNSFE